MKKAKVLFFAADPHSAPPYGRANRLLLDDDIREIREKVRASEHRDALDFDYRLAARPDDLIQALNEVQPHVVHFSGHGWSDGLFLMDARGQRPHSLDRDDLAELFRIFRGQIRVVVLNACLSHPQAAAIAEIVGCAIGMRGKISDAAAIAFGAAFYRAIGFGRSVQEAFDQGRLAIASSERDCPQLVTARGVDPRGLFVLEAEPEPKPKRIRARTGVAAVVLTALAGVKLFTVVNPPACAWAGTPLAAESSIVALMGVQSEIERAKANYETGRSAEAFAQFRRLAGNGDPEAMRFIGVMFLRGHGIQERADSGIYWLREAAYRRNPQAMTTLADAYQQGDGVRRSIGRAREWYVKAAEEKNSPEAMRRLGALHVADQDHGKALTWFQSAVKAGSLDARIDAGQLNEHGLGTPRDLKMAMCLYRTAADAGSPRGMLVMARNYREGIGVRRDYGKAAAWYGKAAQAGSPEGMRALGELFLDGLGVRRDTARARAWFASAAAAGRQIADVRLAEPGTN